MTRRPQPAGGDARSAHRRQDRASIALDTSLHPMLRAGGQAVFTPDRLPRGERGVWGGAPRSCSYYVHLEFVIDYPIVCRSIPAC